MKVNLPKVEEETRAELNIIKARRKDKSLDDTLQSLIEDSKELVEAKELIKNYEDMIALIRPILAENGSFDEDCKIIWRSESQKLHNLMKGMKEKEELE